MEIAEKRRDSNLELFRIIAMLLIVAHHYVVNSGLMYSNGPIYSDLLSAHSLYLLLLGAWGKTGINCFVLFSGYFMCRSNITARKFVKLVGEWLFYKYVIHIIFWVSGYDQLSAEGLFNLFVPINTVGQNFVVTYILFFLTIPFLNLLIHRMTEKQHIRLLLLCGFIYVLLGTFRRVTMNYVSWFIVLYFISSYISLYPKKLFANRRFWGAALLVSVLLSIASVVVCTWFKAAYGIGSPYYFVEDANTLLALTNGLCGFMFFKNLRIPYSRTINTIAASTFGVLLIHANCDAMRRWLWQDTLDNVGAYYHTWGYAHVLVSVVCVFAVCTVIDMLRIRFIEKPFLNLWDRKSEAIGHRLQAISKKLCGKLNIEE